MDQFNRIEDLRSETGIVDPMDELYLHHSDHSNYVLSTRLLDGRNFNHWKRSVEVSLMAKNKLGFVTGTCPRPPANSPLLHHWDRCNHMVISWLLHSVEKDIVETVLYCRTSSQIWQELGTRFGTSNRTRIYQVQKEISAVDQGNLGILEYFTKFKRLWDEYVILIEHQACDCGSNRDVMKLIRDQQVIQFLMGLNEVYNVVRDNILMMTPPPSIDEAYRFLVQEEQQRGMSKYYVIEGDGSTFASQQARNGNSSFKKSLYYDHCKVTEHAMDKCWKIHGYPSNSGSGSYCDHCKMGGHTMEKCWKLHGYPTANNGASTNSGSRPFCTHCKAFGHVMERCWKLHGYPTDGANTGNGKKIAATTSSSLPPITQEQYQQLLTLLQNHEVKDPTTLLAGPFDEEASGDWK